MKIRTFVSPVQDCPFIDQHLSESEIYYSNQHRHIADRLSYRQAHIMKRCIIGFYTGINPSFLKFGATELGRPYVLNANVSFSLSHTRVYVAVSIVLSKDIAVGVDVECLESIPMDEIDLIATAALTKEEILYMSSQNDPHRHLLKCWTIKESIMKATGLGITCSPLSLSMLINSLRDGLHDSDTWPVFSYLVDSTCVLSKTYKSSLNGSKHMLDLECRLIRDNSFETWQNFDCPLTWQRIEPFDTVRVDWLKSSGK